MSAAEKERERIMAKARREKYLSPADRAKLTSGQIAKLKSQGHLNDNPTGLRTPESAVQIQTINGKPTVVSVNGVPTFGNPGNLPTTTTNNDPPKARFDWENIPEDEQYRLDRAARERALQITNSSIGAEEDRSSSVYDLGFGRTGTGDVDFNSIRFPDQARYDADRGFDTANPFSRASLLNQAFTSNRKISMGGYANRGLLTSGAYGRAQYRDADRYNRGSSDLLNEFKDRLAAFRTQRAQARSEFETGNIDDRQRLVQRALQAFQLNNPSA